MIEVGQHTILLVTVAAIDRTVNGSGADLDQRAMCLVLCGCAGEVALPAVYCTPE